MKHLLLITHYQPTQPDASFSFVLLGVVVGIIIFFSIKTVNEDKLIRRAAKLFFISDKLIPYLRTDLLSFYKHQPKLKVASDRDFYYLVTTNDLAHYQCVINKSDTIQDRINEYGEDYVLSHM